MPPEMFGCCKEQPSWIFIYENNEIYTICDFHFTSVAHRCFVKDIVDYKTRKRYTPEQIFADPIVSRMEDA